MYPGIAARKCNAAAGLPLWDERRIPNEPIKRNITERRGKNCVPMGRLRGGQRWPLFRKKMRRRGGCSILPVYCRVLL